MVLPPRDLLIRLVFWAAVFAWAVWKMQDLSGRDAAMPDLLGIAPAEAPAAPVVTPLPQPGSWVVAEGDVPEVVDPVVDAVAAVAALDAAEQAARGCGVRGTLGVELGAAGLEAAWVRDAQGGADAFACLAGAVWSGAWPRGSVGFEMERLLSGEAEK